MTIFYIKIIAIITMVIDHIGVFLLPEVFFLRIIGRVSFLLFAWLLANGAVHTRSITSYMKRLFIFALLSEIPFRLLLGYHDSTFWKLNIFFTLFLGLTAIVVFQRMKSMVLRVCIIFGIVLLARQFTSGFSYGAYGVITILIFYLSYKNLPLAFLLQAVAIFIFYTLSILLSGDSLQHFYENKSIGLIEPVGLLSFVVIASYNGLEGRKMRGIFYFIYPLQLFVIYVLLSQSSSHIFSQLSNFLFRLPIITSMVK